MSRRHLTIDVPARVSSLAPFVAAGVLATVDVAFAALIESLLPADLSRRRREHVVLAAALASRAPRHGHVAVNLRTIESTVAVDLPANPPEADAPGLDDLPWPDPLGWCAMFDRATSRAGGRSPIALGASVGRADPVLNTTGIASPLLYRDGLLYLHRYHQYECDTARALNERAGPLELRADALDRLAELLPEPGPQRDAVVHALEHRLSIIAGGPGTGKTYTLTRLLLATMELEPAAAIALAAPTGKAASRMKDAVAEAAIGLSDELAERVRSMETFTLHRLLGYRDGIRFRHDRATPLPHDLVIVDEVSMVSLPLMSRLLDAIKPGARLVLVGDPHQLASVEAGAVLGDLTSATGKVAATITTLTDAHRFATGSGIGELADAIRHGDGDRAMDILGDDGTPEVELIHPSLTGEVLAHAVASGRSILDLARAGEVQAAAAETTRLKVLCATHGNPNGRLTWHRRIESGVLAAARDRAHRGRWYVGRPVIVTANDYLLNLFNGDTGIVALDGRRRRVYFPRSANPAGLAPEQVGSLETWWAMTIHKSQGSEFDHAVVCLPELGSPVLTRELLYTGVTRARQRVTIVASSDAVLRAIAHPVRRASGLVSLLETRRR